MGSIGVGTKVGGEVKSLANMKIKGSFPIGI
jgi:hypothetical protein